MLRITVIGISRSRSLKAIDALARYRGSTINVKAAEAFMLIRIILIAIG